MGMFELIKEFRSKTEGKDTPPSMRLLYYELLFEFNDSFWKTDLAYSERELSILTGMSKTAINKAINLLSDYGFIKVNRSHGRRTKFTLKSDHVPTFSRPLSDLEKATGRPSELVSYTHARAEDTKTSRLQDNGGGVAGVHAGGSDGGDGTKKPSEEVKNVFVGFFHLMDWNDEYALSELEKRYGKEMLTEAITTAFVNKHARDKNLLAYIRGILNNKKGVKNNGVNSKDANDDINAEYYNLR